VLATLHPLIAVVAATMWFLLSKVTGKASVASIGAVVLVPIGMAVAGAPAWEYLATIAVCALILVRHADNIRRLVRREEHSLTPTP
jgi:glycerol-3-phosphate acyltransferase PlsY